MKLRLMINERIVSCCSLISPFFTFIHWVQIGSLAALVHSDNAKRLLSAHQSPDTLISTAPSYLIWSIARSWSKCDCTLCLWFTFLAKRWMDTLQVRWVTGEIEQSRYVLSHCEILIHFYNVAIYIRTCEFISCFYSSVIHADQPPMSAISDTKPFLAGCSFLLTAFLRRDSEKYLYTLPFLVAAGVNAWSVSSDFQLRASNIDRIRYIRSRIIQRPGSSGYKTELEEAIQNFVSKARRESMIMTYLLALYPCAILMSS